ncbi:MAG: hypothetical protein KKH98_08370 [Spirochaetes bacterium]|nr:hypothetical protein [Spirochaetota bacterium]
MLRKTLTIILLSAFFFIHCGDDDYEVDYDKEKVFFGYKNGVIVFENNLNVPVILDNIKVNDKEIMSFIKYETCDYVKYRDEVVIDYKDKANQVIHLEHILLPGKKIEFSRQLKKKDEAVLEIYPVSYAFLSDNVYFNQSTKDKDKERYKLYGNEEIKKLDINGFKDKKDVDTIQGIMIFVKEYEQLEDTFEELEFEVD